MGIFKPNNILKENNSPLLTAYMVAHAVIVGWVALGCPITGDTLTAAGKLEWGKFGGALVITLFVRMLNRLGSSDLKAHLVFWRFRDPYPGSRAFTHFAPKDQRVDLGRLRQAVGGPFPTDPTEQNRAWYRLYEQRSEKPGVQNSHREYLLFRDMAWLSLLVGGLSGLFILVVTGNWSTATWYVAGCLALYVAARTAAKLAGQRFVCTVLAAASGAASPPPSPIVTLT